MLTVRSSFLIFLSVFGLAFGILIKQEAFALISLAILLLVWLQWLSFASMRRSTRKFRESFVRLIDGQSDATVTMVTDRTYEIELRFDLSKLRSGYRVTIQDGVADGFVVTGLSQIVFESPRGSFLPAVRKSDPNDSESPAALPASTSVASQASNPSSDRKMARLKYLVQTPVCGKFLFTGVKLEIADAIGFFRSQQFIALNQTLTVLPFLIRPQTTVSILKHNNLQQHLGHHRHRSAGISSELHGIRDYRPGDPPRSIAWKATAKLGKIMTSEYENEVPVRATLIVDLGGYQFEGRPKASAGDRSISTTASIARLLLADRDPVAALFINDRQTMRIEHGCGERHLAKVMQFLIQSSDTLPPLSHFRQGDLIKVVFEHAVLRFPDLMDEKYNHGRLPFAGLRFGKAESDYFRRPLAVLFAHLYRLPVGAAISLQYSEPRMRELCLRYARDYALDSTSTSLALDPPYSDVGQWFDARNRNWLEISDRLNQVRAKAKENELFVIIAPEPFDMLSLELMETAIKTTVAAKHRCIFIAPEPPTMPTVISDSTAAQIFQRHHSDSYRTADSEFGNRLGSLGVAFTRIDDPSLMQLVAAEVGMLAIRRTTGREGESIMHNTPDLTQKPSDNFVEATQLIDSHRRPVAWMLAVQIAVLGILSISLTDHSMYVQATMLATLAGLLWYGNSYWLTSFCIVVFGGQMIRSDGHQFSFSSGVHLTECILMMLILIVSFRYIEHRSYGHAFGLGDSFRRLKAVSSRKRAPWIAILLGQIVRRQWYHSVIALVAAFALLRRIQADNYWRDVYWMQPVAARLIVLALLLFFAWFICRAVLSMWDWFLLTPEKADVAFRSWANRELWGDMAGVERRIERLRLREED